MGWYYAIYHASKSMIIADSGQNPETHRDAIRAYHGNILVRKLAVHPFDMSLDGVIDKEVKKEIKSLKNGNKHPLRHTPTNTTEAWGALCEYLSGNATFERDKIDAEIKKSKDFKALNVQDFRTKPARELRNSRLGKRHVNFLSQAFRYRGKANYRDAVVLCYGDNHQVAITQMVDDLYLVAERFVDMAGGYLQYRLKKSVAEAFIADLKANVRFDL